MNAHRKTWFTLVAITSVAVAVVACSGARTGAVPAGQAQLAVNLVDAPNPAVDQIWVGVERVVAHTVPGGWITVSTTPVQVDLLKLQSSAQALGLTTLPPGTVTQIRLVVAADGNYVVVGGAQVPLQVPSGAESGIKIKGPWDLTECNQTAVTLDFDGKNSIHLTLAGDRYVLRPVIRVKKAEASDVGCQPPATTDGGTQNPPPPPPQGAGATCTAAGECLSANCTGNVCVAGPGGAPCQTNGDCLSKSCGTDATCAPVPTASPAGTACTVAADCLSNNCQTTCQPSLQGQPCNLNTDCADGMTCSASTCVPPAAL